MSQRAVAGRKTILLVEDEALIALVQMQLLERKGYAVQHVATGEEAVEAAIEHRNRVDLVLMDINLGPGIDGTEAAERILEHVDIPVVFLSSHTDPEIVEKTERITSYGYVVKDSGIIVLDASVKMALKLFDARMERLRVEQALQMGHSQMRAIIDTVPSYIFAKDIDGRFLLANKAVADVFGVDPGKIAGRTDLDGGATEEQVRAYRVMDRDVIETGKARLIPEEQIVRKDGTMGWFQTVKIPYTHPGWNIPAVLGVSTDITERKEAEQNYLLLSAACGELQFCTASTVDYNRIAETARLLCGAAFAALNVYGRDGKSFTTVAVAGIPEQVDRAVSLLGFRFVGQAWKPDAVREVALDGNRTSVFASLSALTKDVLSGSAIRMIEKVINTGEVAVTRISIETRHVGDFTLIFSRKQRLKNRALLEMYAGMVGVSLTRMAVESRNEELVRQKETLIREVQHRIKNNMNTMTSLLSLQAHAARDSATAGVLIEAQSRFRSMEILYDRLYRTDNQDSGSLVEYLNTLVHQVADLFPSAAYVTVTVEPKLESHRADPPEGTHVRGACVLNAGQLSIVGLIVNELVTNSMKHAFPDADFACPGTLGVTITCREEIVEICVTDNGPGMLDSCQRGDPPGFGIAMVRTLTDRLNGTVRFERNNRSQTRGTRVVIEFPRITRE